MIKHFLINISAYFRLISLSAKSHFKSVWGMVISAFIAPLIIAAAFVAAGPLIAGSFAQPRLDLIFCDLEGTMYFDTVLDLLLADESVTRTVTIRKLDYDEALAELGSGGADAVIIFPEDFISDMSRGINRPLRILGNESDPVRTVFIREFMQSAADQLSAAQSAINTVWFNTDTQNMSEARRNIFFTSLVLEYTSKAFARGIYYTFHNVEPAHESSSAAAFLTASALAAIVFFGSLPGVKQILKERRAGITARLAASGVSGISAAFYHFIPIYFKQLLCACFAVLIALPAVTIATASPQTGQNINAAVTAGANAAVMAEANGAVTAGANGALGIGGEDLAAIGDVITSAMGAIGHLAPVEGGGGGGGEIGDANGAAGGAPGAGSEIGDTGGAAGRASDVADGAPGAGVAGVAGVNGGSVFSLAGAQALFRVVATRENASRLASAFFVMAILCLFTSSLALFIGYMLKRAESADLLIVTVGIVMAIAGGTVIPYPFMPDIFQSIGPFCFNRWAQSLIASALFGGDVGDGAPALIVFALLAALLVAASALRIKRKNHI